MYTTEGLYLNSDPRFFKNKGVEDNLQSTPKDITDLALADIDYARVQQFEAKRLEFFDS